MKKLYIKPQITIRTPTATETTPWCGFITKDGTKGYLASFNRKLVALILSPYSRANGIPNTSVGHGGSVQFLNVDDFCNNHVKVYDENSIMKEAYPEQIYMFDSAQEMHFWLSEDIW